LVMIFVRSGAKAGTAKNAVRQVRSALATTNSEGAMVHISAHRGRRFKLIVDGISN